MLAIDWSLEIVALFFAIITIFIISTISYQRSKLLAFHVVLEIVLSIYIINLLSYTEFIIYFIFTLPFLKSYLIWKYMYNPVNSQRFQFVITKSYDDINELFDRLYAQIHIILHFSNISDPDEVTQLLTNKNTMHYYNHKKDTVECWKMQYQFMCLSIDDKKKHIHGITKIHSTKMKQFLKIIWAICSFLAYIYPIIRSIISWWTDDGRISNRNISKYESMVNEFMIIIYCIVFVCMIGCVKWNKLYRYWAMKCQGDMIDRYRLKHKWDYNLNSATTHCYIRMQQIKLVSACFGMDIALLIIGYIVTQRAKSNQIKSNQIFDI